ncbi:MAG: HDIG domain-containing protein [candidate division Zixibacteria bacterium]|nr:HDIG domain-containing protein [candidate division Zixibacteria bacterium]
MMCRLAQDTVGDILTRGRIFEVGGAVRDRIINPNLRIKDRDYLVTGIPYEELTKILRRHGRVDLVGRSFGVIKFTQTQGGQPYTFDIALPRREHSTGLGHKDFEVAFNPDLSVEEDLARRDFTVNAMAIAQDNQKLIDPLGGEMDLRNRQLRMTSPESFTEDPLRMLRAIQFAARFDFEIEPETYRALTERVALIQTVSAERIAEELVKLLTLAEKPSDGFRLMRKSGLLREILPELEVSVGVDQPGGYHKYDVFEHSIRCIDACDKNLRLRLAAMFHDISKPQAKRPSDTGATFYGHEMLGARVARRVMTRLRFSNSLIDEVATLVERHMFTTGVTDKGLRRLVRKVGVDLIFDLLDLRRADVIAQGMGGHTDDVDQFEKDIREELSRKPPFSYSDLALNGHDIMKLFDLKPSPTVGAILEHLMEAVLDNPEHNTKELLETLAQNYYQMLIVISASDSEETER